MQCYSCQRQLSPDEPVWLHVRRVDRIRNTPWRTQHYRSWERVHNCAKCAREPYGTFTDGFTLPLGRVRKWKTPYWRSHPCFGCGRKIYQWHDPRDDTYQTQYLVPACSPECQRKRRLTLANERRRKSKSQRRCSQCEREFVPKRKDARYCSTRCRQAAHRQRPPAGFYLPPVLRSASSSERRPAATRPT